MFIGEYSHTIDAKGRLIVPLKFREQLGNEFVVTNGFEGCLYMYDNSEFNAFGERLHALSITDPNARVVTRFFLTGACACEVDRQGRILIPQVLRNYANLKKNVVLAGNGGRIEIWDEETWNDKKAADFKDIESIAQKLGLVL